MESIKRRVNRKRQFIFLIIILSGIFLVSSLILAILIPKISTQKSSKSDAKPYLEISQTDQVFKLHQALSNLDNAAPEITLESPENISVCPNGKILGLKYKITDNTDGDITESAKTTLQGDNIIIFSKDKSNNISIEKLSITKEDNSAPEISISGEPKIFLVVGAKYQDAGASAKDNCDEEVSIETSGGVDANKIGTYTITYKAIDSTGNTSEAQRIVSIVDAPKGKRIIYLTFDDGPGPYTAQLLDVLKKHNVKATFFVTGSGSDDLIRREYAEGHAIGLHTYSHAYAYIYSATANFWSDISKIQTRVKNATGYTSTLIRFPGGSSNTVSRAYDGGQRIMSKLTAEASAKGFTYYDWNISSGDAGETTSTDRIYSNVINNLKSDYSVVLQHDIKGFSVAAVERIIEYGKSHGYTFAKLEPGSFAAHHGVNN